MSKSEGFKILLDKIFLLSLVVPIFPVVIPLAVDLSDVVSGDLVVRRPTGAHLYYPALQFGHLCLGDWSSHQANLKQT